MSLNSSDTIISQFGVTYVRLSGSILLYVGRATYGWVGYGEIIREYRIPRLRRIFTVGFELYGFCVVDEHITIWAM